MYTPRGNLKQPSTQNYQRSNIDIGGRSGWTDNHFTTTSMRDNSGVQSSKLHINRIAAPDKNADSDPQLWGSTKSFPARETFTTTRETMDAPDKSMSKMRASARAALSDWKPGYPEAAAKNPWKTSAMRQFKDPLLGARKKGPTALPQPVFPAPAPHSNPITGVRAGNQNTNLFERYHRDASQARISNDTLYKHTFNPSAGGTNWLQHTFNPSAGGTNTSHISKAGTTRKRPTLGTLGAIRP
eukprot:TRINITY_DN3861_c0_g1_i1.p1 TRINITY_DN3861_c0_g1~~TRINITY_DN3861_c0_g1_i1.p1  ORF type:complete len:242 (-),score=45.67 TRINITY_DN3861_c0_g1_i1:266-991(-)